jgi:ParB family chromosome partitioning protein
MPKSVQKITLSQSRDIPFSRLVLSQAIVRRIKAGVSIEELAEDIVDVDSGHALFAHCVALSVKAVHPSWNRRPRALAHACHVAEAVSLDVAAGWSPRIENYLGRVTKARILQAVREARGEQAAQLIDHLKKGEMAERARELVARSGWLPEPLGRPGRAIMAASPTPDV